MSNQLDIELRESSINMLAPEGELLVRRFYGSLFSGHPQVRPMFTNTNPRARQKKMLAALQLVIANLRKSETLKSALDMTGLFRLSRRPSGASIGRTTVGTDQAVVAFTAAASPVSSSRFESQADIGESQLQRF